MNEPDPRKEEEEKVEEVNEPEVEEKEEEEEEEQGEKQETPPAAERKVSPVEAEEKALTSPKQKDYTPPRRGRNEPDSGTILSLATVICSLLHPIMVRRMKDICGGGMWHGVVITVLVVTNWLTSQYLLAL